MTDEFFDAVSFGERLNEMLKKIERLEQNLQRQQQTIAHKDNRIRKLQRDLKSTEDRYQKICSENRELNALFTKQQKDKDKERLEKQL